MISFVLVYSIKIKQLYETAKFIFTHVYVMSRGDPVSCLCSGDISLHTTISQSTTWTPVS
jgi:hypothetical protein